MNAFALLPTTAPNTPVVQYGGLGQLSSVFSAALTGAVALTTTYFGWRQQHDAQKREEHAVEREAAARAEAAKAAQAQQIAAAQTAAVQLATSGAQAGGGMSLPQGAAGLLGSPVVLLGGAAVAVVLVIALMGRRR